MRIIPRGVCLGVVWIGLFTLSCERKAAQQQELPDPCEAQLSCDSCVGSSDTCVWCHESCVSSTSSEHCASWEKVDRGNATACDPNYEPPPGGGSTSDPPSGAGGSAGVGGVPPTGAGGSSSGGGENRPRCLCPTTCMSTNERDCPLRCVMSNGTIGCWASQAAIFTLQAPDCAAICASGGGSSGAGGGSGAGGSGGNSTGGTCARTSDDPRNCKQGDFACGGGCCPAGAPFLCSSLAKCYPTAAEATKACGNTCWACLPGTGAPGGGTGGSGAGGGAGGAGGAGGVAGCDWTSATNCVSVVKAVTGTRCGQPDSIEVTVRNACSQAIKVVGCLEKSNGSWVCLPDGNFDAGLAPGAQWVNFSCDTSGRYKIYAMPITTFLQNRCSYPRS
jgi:hypothetical protein